MIQNTEGDCNDSELDEELELLRAMWPSEEELDIQRPTCAKCRISGDVAAAKLVARLAPNTGGEEQSRYIRCEVVIVVPFGYPGNQEHPVLPQVHLGSSSGLTDKRRAELLAALEDLFQCDFAGLSGAFPTVLQTAQDQLTTWNDEGPMSQCPVCLVELGHGERTLGLASNSAAADHLRLPCYHILHASCFAQFWEAEWLRQRKDFHRNKPTGKEQVALAVSEAEVTCPECRQGVAWVAVPQIHAPLGHLLETAFTQDVVVPEGDSHDEEREASKEVTENGVATTDASAAPYLQNGVALSSQEQRVDLFEVVMPRGLRTRLKPKWDARDQEGPVLRNGACGVVAEFVEGKDATYFRPEGTDYWLPLNGGRNNCKMVRIDQDMPRPSKAPSGWIHGDTCLDVDVAASTPPRSAKTQTADPTGMLSSRKDKKIQSKNSCVGYASGHKVRGA
jgi:hypothetical protein